VETAEVEEPKDKTRVDPLPVAGVSSGPFRVELDSNNVSKASKENRRDMMLSILKK
jgi:hypothetical protein